MEKRRVANRTSYDLCMQRGAHGEAYSVVFQEHEGRIHRGRA
jgi:hypothetical protein